MLPLQFRLTLFFDRLLASKRQKRDAYRRATETLLSHGADSISVLLATLCDARRSRSRRTIRLAIGKVDAGQHVLIPTIGTNPLPVLSRT